MSQAPRIFTAEEIEILKRSDLPMSELESMLSTSYKTIRKYQKLYGITWTRTTKKGVPRPYQMASESRVCLNQKCLQSFTVKPAMTKQYCSRSCFVTVNNPGAKGKGSRTIRNPNRDAYKRYAGLVHALSQEIYEQYIDLINPNQYPRTLCGVEGGWQLDHIMPIKECFEKAIPAEQAASLNNLRMLPWKDNLMRNFN